MCLQCRVQERNWREVPLMRTQSCGALQQACATGNPCVSSSFLQQARATGNPCVSSSFLQQAYATGNPCVSSSFLQQACATGESLCVEFISTFGHLHILHHPGDTGKSKHCMHHKTDVFKTELNTAAYHYIQYAWKMSAMALRVINLPPVPER